MKRLSTIMICLFAMTMASLSAKAQEITIYLMPGWNWISYTNAVSMDIDEALGDFVPMEGDMLKSKYSSTKYSNGQWRGRLEQFTPGLGYHYYSNRGEPVSFVFANPNLQPQVTVTTSEPLLITAISAMSGGEVTVSDGTYILVKGICWATHETPTSNDSYLEEGSGEGSFSATMTGLNWSTTYYVRAYAVTPNGTVYGNEKVFTTRDGIPTVTTADITNILGDGATSGGNVTDDGGLDVVSRGVCWSTNHNPTMSDSHTTNGSGHGDFTSYIYGINTSTTYYVRAYATTVAGTGYGEELYFNTRNGIPTVTTATVSGIGPSYVNCGGNVLDDGGLTLTARGVCWSTSPNPTISDHHTLDGSADIECEGEEEPSCWWHYYYTLGSFSSFLRELSPNTTYYVRAYASTRHGTGYGNEESFTTIGFEDHDYIDLGLPSGLLWATCNVGANTTEEYGDYFAWGEIQSKDRYNWNTYLYYESAEEYGENRLIKYYDHYDRFDWNWVSDSLTILLPEDDAATVNWGNDWRMPTKAEWEELKNHTTVTWTTQNGVYGKLFTASNGNSLFLPAAGCRHGSGLNNAGSRGYYWSSSLYTNEQSAWYYSIGSSNNYLSYNYRDYGQSVRAVRDNQNNHPTGAINGKFTINADGDQVYFSQGNLQYQASTNTWKFAESQYDYIGDANSNISSTYDGWIDLFGWGTSGYNHGANCYQPWSTSTSNSDYYAYGSYTYNLYDQTGQADWGYNPISNGGNQANHWRTLTQPEWDYVFNTRTTISGIRYAKAKVNDMNGVILLPDEWSSETSNLSNTNSPDASFSSNAISASQWNTLEQAGAVFLPAAGSRYGTSFLGVGYGCYWSASCYFSYGAYWVGFDDEDLYTGYNFDRYVGQSVRLVAPAEN